MSNSIILEIKKHLKTITLNEKDMKIFNNLTDSDFDIYYKTCILCNGHYPISNEILEYRNRLHSDYEDMQFDVVCTNLKKLNKYNLYQYYINDVSMLNLLWKYKDKDALVYVAEDSNGLLVSIRKEQFRAFKEMLDELDIKYNKKEIDDYITYKNQAKHKMITLDHLPFKPFPYQIEDIQHLLTLKRAIIGHEMGCILGDERVDVIIENTYKSVTLEELYQLNTNFKVKCLVDNHTTYIKGKVIYSGKQFTLDIKTKNNTISCTYDHLILTEKGWKRADQLEQGDKIISVKGNETITANAFKDTYRKQETYIYNVDEVVSVQQQVSGFKKDVYDIQILDKEISNFICNGLVVHNCGKTLIASSVGASIKGKKVVVCPESLRINWEREIQMVDPNTEIEIVHSSDSFKKLTKEWTIFGYKTASKFVKLINPKVLIIDEAHFIKSVDNWGNPKSSRAKVLIDLSDRSEYVYALTGTPIPSKNLDLYNLLKIVKSEMYDFNSKSTFFKFANRYCDPKKTRFGTDYSRNSNSQELHQFLSKNMIRRIKKEVLPHLVKQRQFIPIRPKLTKEYIGIEKRLHPLEDGDTFMSLAMSGRRVLSKLKVDTAQDLIETILNNNEQVVVVTNFIETADILKEEYGKIACEIRGGMKDKDKQKSIDDFQEGKKQICILNMQAGGVGVTLTKAKYLIMLDYDWIPANNIQTEDRICRTGQTELCTIYYIYCDNSIFDRVFVKMLTEKSENISKVVDNATNQFDLELEKNLSYYKALEKEVNSEQSR